ncbi:hypothetical protein AX16_001845 [Volvariella volvacea WC 439]|nr:hypothetical protein AX16_001845 [Volvariella volvacea WC 439]
MSSSRRSVRSLRSPKPPTWSSRSVIKNTPSSSLSYIFAEPQQGAPLAPAASKLPATALIRPTEANSIKDIPEVPSSEATSTPSSSGDTVDGPPNEHKLGGNAEVAPGPEERPADASPPAASDPQPGVAAPPAPDPQSSPLAVSKPPEDQITAEQEPPVNSTSNRSSTSWFATFTRNKVKDKPHAPAPAPNTSPTPVIPPTINVITAPPSTQSTTNEESTPNEELRQESTSAVNKPKIPIEPNTQTAISNSNPTASLSAPQSTSTSDSKSTTAPVQSPSPAPPPRRSWFSSSRPQPPPPSPAQQMDQAVAPVPSPQPPSDIQAQPEQTSSAASPPEPPCVHPTPDEPEPQTTTTAPIATPPPPPPPPPQSSSRFAIPIPFLGRKKAPPEAAPTPKPNQEELALATTSTTVDTAKEEAESPVLVSVEPPSPSDNGPNSVCPQPPSQSAPIAASESESTPEHEPEAAVIPSTSSWWSYVGWSSSSSGRIASDQSATSLNAVPETAPEEGPHAPDTANRSSNPIADTKAGGSNNTVEARGDDSNSNNTCNNANNVNAKGMIAGKENGNGTSTANVDSAPSQPTLRTEKTETTTESQRDYSSSQPQGSSGTSLDSGSASGSGYAWYSPWGWYGSSSTATTATNVSPLSDRPAGGAEAVGGNGGDSASGVGEGAVGDADRKVGAKEMESVSGGVNGNASIGEVRSENGDGAQSRGHTAGQDQDGRVDETQSQPPSSNQKTGTSPPSSEINPVGLTIQTHRSAWAYFFSSKTIAAKTITEKGEHDGEVKRDENGMEIMDLDDDEEGGAGGDSDTKMLPTPTRRLAIEAPPPKSAATQVKSAASTPPPPSPKQLVSLSKEIIKKPNEKDGGVSPVESVRSDAGQSKKSTTTAASVTSASPSAVASNTTSSPTTASAGPPASAAVAGKSGKRVSSSPAPSKRSGRESPVPAGARTPTPNLVLPNWADVFHTAPRNIVPPPPPSKLSKTINFVNDVLFSKDVGVLGGAWGGSSASTSGTGSDAGVSGSDILKEKENAKGTGKSKGKGRMTWKERELEARYAHFGKELPRAWDVMNAHARMHACANTSGTASTAAAVAGWAAGKTGIGGTKTGAGATGVYGDVLRGCENVAVIGIHGWFPGVVMRTVLGEPTGTSSKFANMTVQALEDFQQKHNVELKKITKIPLEGDGTITQRVEKLYSSLLANEEWVQDIHNADAIFIATHSQGSVVSTHLLDRLIRDGHIVTAQSVLAAAPPETLSPGSSVSTSTAPPRKPQRVCCLALCGIHLGPLRYLRNSTLVQPYIQYFESAAARELFEFQNTDSAVSKAYVAALGNVVKHGVKMVYVASLNDQVVPLYSGLFAAASHPLILRALYIDGDAYHSSDFLSNLLVLLLRVLNSGLSDSGLITHLSEATAGSLNGVGHSTAYEELATYSLAVNYLFLTNDGLEQQHPELTVESFDALTEQNDYEIPWSLRDLIADERIAHFFSREIAELKDAFRDWHPKTSILRDVKRKLQPIQRLNSTVSGSSISSISRL